jgi:ubiquitin-like protein Pup
MAQIQKTKNRQKHAEATQTTEQQYSKEQLDNDVDDLLAEIEDVLEENAEEFVANFINRGGQ